MTTQPSSIKGRLAQVNVVVGDMARSTDFYQLLGVAVGDMPSPWDQHHRTVTNVAPEVTVEYDSVPSVANWAPVWTTVRTGVVIGIAVDHDGDVDAAVAVVEQAGHRVLQPPHDAFFGARYALVEDPDGNPVGIMGPIRPDRHWMPDPPS